MHKNGGYKLLVVLWGWFILSACGGRLAKIQRSNDYEYKLKMAENFYAKKKYTNAQILFESLIPVFKGTSHFEDIYYKYAYCAYNLQDYLNAENLFKTFLETFPSSSKAEEVEYMRAYSYYKQSPKVELDQTNTTKTIALMQAFINTHPNAKEVEGATHIIDVCRNKLEEKEFAAAQLYFNLGRYKAAAVALNNLIINFPESSKGDAYKLLVIKAYYQYAENSIIDKQLERYKQVIAECNDFTDRYASSKLINEVNRLQNQTQNNINNLQHEQIKKTTGS